MPLASAAASLAGILVLARQALGARGRVRLYKAAFAAQLAAMLVGQALEFYSSLGGWTPGLYKVYYFSSPLSAGLLAVGVALLAGAPRLAGAFLAYTAAVEAALAARLAGAPVDVAVLEELGPGVGGAALPGSVRVLSPILTVPSGLAVLALAARGYVRDREGRPAYAAILAGNLVFLVAGGLLRAGYGDAFLVLELAATLLLVYGFARS